MVARFYRAIGPGGAFPGGKRAEIVFCGRSNVGKSSLLNALTGVKGLARTSKTPGRTREIHFYEDGNDRFLVDLPGYGYAKVSQEDRRAWAGLVEAYLDREDRIAMAILLVDARHPPFEMDLALSQSLVSRGFPYVVVLTKGDKTTMSERTRVIGRARDTLGGPREILLTSARTGVGIRDLARLIDATVSPLRDGARSGNMNSL